MPKIKTESRKSRVHIKASTFSSGLPAVTDLPSVGKLFPEPSILETTKRIPRLKIDKSEINYKNPFGDVLIDKSILTAQVNVYDKLKAAEAKKDAETVTEHDKVTDKKEEQTTVVQRLNKKQRRLEKRDNFLKKLQKERDELRKPKKKKVCLKEFKTMRSALSDVITSKSSADMASALMSDVFSMMSSPMDVTTPTAAAGSKKKNEHMIIQKDLRKVPKFLRKKKIQKNFDDILCFQQAIQQKK